MVDGPSYKPNPAQVDLTEDSQFDDLSALSIGESETSVSTLMGHVCTAVGAESEQNIEELRSYAEKALGHHQDKYELFAQALQGSMADGVLTDTEKLELIDFIEDELEKERDLDKERAKKKSKDLEKNKETQERLQQVVKDRVVQEMVSLIVGFMEMVRGPQNRASQLHKLLMDNGLGLFGLDSRTLDELLSADPITQRKIIMKVLSRQENHVFLVERTREELAQEILEMAARYRQAGIGRVRDEILADEDVGISEVTKEQFVSNCWRLYSGSGGPEDRVDQGLHHMSCSELGRYLSAQTLSRLVEGFAAVGESSDEAFAEVAFPNSITERCLHSNVFHRDFAYQSVLNISRFIECVADRLRGVGSAYQIVSRNLKDRGVSLFDVQGRGVSLAHLLESEDNSYSDEQVLATLAGVVRDERFVFAGGREIETIYFPDIVICNPWHLPRFFSHVEESLGVTIDPWQNVVGREVFARLEEATMALQTLKSPLGLVSSQIQQDYEQLRLGASSDGVGKIVLSRVVGFGLDEFSGPLAFTTEDRAVHHPSDTYDSLLLRYPEPFVQIWKDLNVLLFDSQDRRMLIPQGLCRSVAGAI
jgi:hypothetical protein